MLKGLLLVSLIMGSQVLRGQPTIANADPSNLSSETPSLNVYKTYPKWEIPVSIVLISAASLGYKEMDKIASITHDEVLALNPQDVNSFDRPACFYDPAGFKDAESKSDILMTAFVISPIFLVFDKKIKKDWAEMLGMLLVAHAVDNTLLFTAFLSVRAPRPLTYNPGLETDQKTGNGKTNSFFSGHVSWTATSTFFIAKVYTDYHQIKGIKRLAIYSAAALPPVVVGYYRVHAGRHFPTDALVGLVTGAACGILVPELHRIKKNSNIGLNITPFSKLGASGFTLCHVFK